MPQFFLLIAQVNFTAQHGPCQARSLVSRSSVPGVADRDRSQPSEWPPGAAEASEPSVAWSWMERMEGD